MIRPGALFWLLLVIATGFATFKVKYAVQDLDDELAKLRKQTVAEQQEIRVLAAEWTYLVQPERLAELNKRFLQLGPINPKQLQRAIEEIPIRAPAEANAAPTDELVAAPPKPSPSTPGQRTVVAAAVPALPAPLAVAAPAPRPVPIPAPNPTAAETTQTAAAHEPSSLDALFRQVAETR